MPANRPEAFETDRPRRSVSPCKAGFSCSCPSCGDASLYINLLEVKPECEACGFDLSSADPGDGAQIFVILILGGILALMGFILVGAFNLPIWVTLIVMAVLTIVGAIWLLRVFKATLIALQFHHDAHEGVLQESKGE